MGGRAAKALGPHCRYCRGSGALWWPRL